MKKLYEHIEDIEIIGGVDQLSEVVTIMDQSLQNIAENTEILVEYLAKYSESNKGKQYERVVNTSLDLRDKLLDASEELNDMQNQIVAYQNKVYRYEDMPEAAQQPNPYLVTKRMVNVDTSAVKFVRADMENLARILTAYSENVYRLIKDIEENKNSIASVWRDSQYYDFSVFIDEIVLVVENALMVFDNYVEYLNSKIKELD